MLIGKTYAQQSIVFFGHRPEGKNQPNLAKQMVAINNKERTVMSKDTYQSIYEKLGQLLRSRLADGFKAKCFEQLQRSARSYPEAPFMIEEVCLKPLQLRGLVEPDGSITPEVKAIAALGIRLLGNDKVTLVHSKKMGRVPTTAHKN